MTGAALAELLRSALVGDDGALEELDAEGLREVSTFEEVGMLTMNAGLVLRFAEGEFQLSIVRSRR